MASRALQAARRTNRHEKNRFGPSSPAAKKPHRGEPSPEEKGKAEREKILADAKAALNES